MSKIETLKNYHDIAQQLMPLLRNNFIVTVVLASVVALTAAFVLLKSCYIKGRIFFVVTLSLIIVGMCALSITIYLQYAVTY